jgi:hypothetical protein
MIIERIKQMISKYLFLKIFIGILIAIIFIFYFKTFFTNGVYFNDTFLKKEILPSERHYTGKSKYGSIQIIVKGLMNNQSSLDVIYRLPNNINEQYTVNFDNINNLEIGILNIKDKDDKIIFQGGVYSRNLRLLIPKDGQPIIYDGQILAIGESPYTDEYKTSLNNIVSFATSDNDMIRGEFQYLVPAIFLLLLTLIDFKFPLFFFTLRNFLSVKDPEPSEIYLTMQRASWFIYPIIALILMLAAIL